MSFLEGLYLVALASVFALIPSGPGYAGTQDAATVIGIKAIGGTGATAVSYLVMLRFVLLVPITVVGLLLLAFRYGGFARAAGGARVRRRPSREVIAYGVLVVVALGCGSTTSATGPSTTTRARTPTSPGSSTRTATTPTTRCCTGRCAST